GSQHADRTVTRTKPILQGFANIPQERQVGIWMTMSTWHGIGVPSRLAGMYLNSRIAESSVCSIFGVAIPLESRASATRPSVSMVTSTIKYCSKRGGSSSAEITGIAPEV